MKRIFALMCFGLLLTACEDVEGNLVGVKRDAFYPDILGPGKVPYGMVYIPSGAYQAGDDNGDIMNLHTARKRTLSVQAFYMDASEISNSEYRQFVNWVRDSIAREKLYRRQSEDDAEQWVNVPEDFFREPYRTVMSLGSDLVGGNNPFDKFNGSDEELSLDKYFLALQGFNGVGTPSVDGLTLPTGKNKIDRKVFSKNGTILNETEISAILANLDGVKFDDLTEDNKLKNNEEAKSSFTLNKGRIQNRKFFNLNWETIIDYQDPEISFLLSDMYVSDEEKFYKNKQIDTRLLFYDYYWIDYKEAAKRGKISIKRDAYDLDEPTFTQRRDDGTLNEPFSTNDKTNDLHRSTLKDELVWLDATAVSEDDIDKDIHKSYNLDSTGKNPGQDLDLGFRNSKGQHNAIRGHSDRSRFVIKERINVYPDTLCWVRDFTYAFHEPMTQNYFWNSAYDNYPVVGVTWVQAKAFSVWRSQLYHSWLLSNGDLYVNDFRLPTETEWERAARGNLANSQFPWGGPYIRNSNGCFLANFKPMRGRYFEDGGFHTVKVYSYNPNEYGLFCMSGNVAEWCNSAFDESTYSFTHDLNSDFTYDAKDDDPVVKKRKVVRGGSWKDIGYYLMNASRSYEYQDSAKCYIGFRNVMTHLGRGGKDLDSENGEEIQMDIQLK